MRFETHTISDNLLKKGEVEMGRSLKKMMTIGSYLFFAVFYPNAYADICHSSLYSHSSYNFLNKKAGVYPYINMEYRKKAWL